MITINGKTITNIGGNSKITTITFNNGKLMINKETINLKDYTDDYIVNIEVDGDCGDITTNGHVSISGSCRSVNTNGHVEVGGDIQGNVDTNGSVECYGDIHGDIDTNGNVSLRRK